MQLMSRTRRSHTDDRFATIQTLKDCCSFYITFYFVLNHICAQNTSFLSVFAIHICIYTLRKRFIFMCCNIFYKTLINMRYINWIVYVTILRRRSFTISSTTLKPSNNAPTFTQQYVYNVGKSSS